MRILDKPNNHFYLWVVYSVYIETRCVPQTKQLFLRTTFLNSVMVVTLYNYWRFPVTLAYLFSLISLWLPFQNRTECVCNNVTDQNSKRACHLHIILISNHINMQSIRYRTGLWGTKVFSLHCKVCASLFFFPISSLIFNLTPPQYKCK